MPYGKRKTKGGKVQVINKATGRVLGTHPNDKDANKQLAALAINDPEGFDKKRSKKR
jgi:hypothetical protein